MKLEVVPFNIAQVLKSKGFNLFTQQEYMISCSGDHWLVDWNQHPGHSEEFIKAPEIDLVIKWLREVHNIHINPIPNFKTNWNQYHLGIVFKNDKSEVDMIILKENNLYKSNKLFESYEQAQIAGIEEALKLI